MLKAVRTLTAEMQRDKMGRACHRNTTLAAVYQSGDAGKQEATAAAQTEQDEGEQWQKTRGESSLCLTQLPPTQAGTVHALQKAGSYTLWTLNHVPTV